MKMRTFSPLCFTEWLRLSRLSLQVWKEWPSPAHLDGIPIIVWYLKVHKSKEIKYLRGAGLPSSRIRARSPDVRECLPTHPQIILSCSTRAFEEASILNVNTRRTVTKAPLLSSWAAHPSSGRRASQTAGDPGWPYCCFRHPLQFQRQLQEMLEQEQ